MAEPSASESSTGTDSDQDFDPSAEMLVNDFDDEHTIDEEEAIGEENAKEEIDELTKEGNMPIEELLALYGYGNDKESKPGTEAEKSSESSPTNSNKLTVTSPQSTSQQQVATPSSSSSAPAAPSLGRAATTSYSNMSDTSDSESDDEFSANEDEWRRTIQVGSDYQAVIPDGLNHYVEGEQIDEDANKYMVTRQDQNRDILLWKPTSLLNDEQLDEFVKMYEGLYDDETQMLPMGEHNRDDDHALYLLFQCQYNIGEALQRHEKNSNPPPESSPVRKMMDPWTEEECRSFETGLRTYGKDFFLIKHNKIASRSVGEVVTFYYFWKKTERHDQFVTKFRVEKKKYALHPGTTDYMDRFLDEQENMTLTSSGTTNTIASSHNSSNLLNPSSSIHNHHHSNISSSCSGRQSSSTPSINYSRHHNNPNESYVSGSSGTSTHISSQNMRTINVNTSGEPQTILINDSDFKTPNQNDKPVVVCTTGTAGSSKSSNFYHGQHHSLHHSNLLSNDATTTIVVGKNPVIIDGTWVSSGGPSAAPANSPTNLSTPSVSIYKISSNSSGFNR